MKFLLYLLCLPGCLAVPGVRAEVLPMDQQQLQRALKAGQPCCVIDGRAQTNRGKHPLADALPYQEGMRIHPTADVVIVADSDRLARKIAAVLDAAYPGRRMIAVRGGVGVWEGALVAASREAAGGAPPGFGFVIPRNTCESGTPLQRLRGNFAR